MPLRRPRSVIAIEREEAILHRNYAQGSDGRPGNDLVKVKTITPFKKTDSVEINMARNFSKLLIVKINDECEIEGQLIDRTQLPKAKGKIRIPGDRLAAN